MDEKELATELVKLINMSPEEKIDKLVEMAMRSAITSAHAADEIGKMRATLEALPQKCLGQRLECEAKFVEIRQGERGDFLSSLSPKKLGVVAVAVLLSILVALGSAVANWLK